MKRLAICLLLLSSYGAFAQNKNIADPSNDGVPEAQGTQTAIARYYDSVSVQRAQYTAWFDEAEATYPQLPKGLLKAVGFTASRWEHLQPADADVGHHHMPGAIGVMGFYDGTGGFRDTLTEAAEALGATTEAVATDARTNIMAGAALLSRYMDEAGLDEQPLEAWVGALQRFSGLPLLPGKTGSFARDSHAYDVLLNLDRGHDDHGIEFAPVPVDFSKAFAPEKLEVMKAPFIRLNPETDTLDIPGYRIDPADEVLKPERRHWDEEEMQGKRSADYPPALWVASPYNWARGASVSDVTIHTAQGSYAGTISWFQNNPYTVSAHYVIRSSDGQITQMVYESRKAAHVGVHNSYTVGIEHEGYVSSASWYTTAMYNASSALTADICDDNGIDPTTTYDGPAHSSVVVLSTAYKVKGHQHYSSQTHTDPGIYWDWSRYYDLINPGGGGGTTLVLDDFEASEGHFYTSPTYSGSTYGISSSSTATRTSSISYAGNYSEQIKLVDNSSSSSSWGVRFLSGAGSTGNNTSLTVSGGKVGFWVYSGGSGMSAALGMDDSDGTERSDTKSIPANQWTWLEWNLDDSSQWNSWYGGNGSLSASTVSLDAIWFFRAQTSYNVYIYIDNVTYSN